jgi:hypothetical protein
VLTKHPAYGRQVTDWQPFSTKIEQGLSRISGFIDLRNLAKIFVHTTATDYRETTRPPTERLPA